MARDFISNVVNLKTSDIPVKVKNFILKQYNQHPRMLDDIKKASTAAGTMVVWVVSQISYADIQTKVEPLKNEIQKLETGGQGHAVAGVLRSWRELRLLRRRPSS
jgi:hypothetical protein